MNAAFSKDPGTHFRGEGYGANRAKDRLNVLVAFIPAQIALTKRLSDGAK